MTERTIPSQMTVPDAERMMRDLSEIFGKYSTFIADLSSPDVTPDSAVDVIALENTRETWTTVENLAEAGRWCAVASLLCQKASARLQDGLDRSGVSPTPGGTKYI